jgi:hypothetical protein
MRPERQRTVGANAKTGGWGYECHQAAISVSNIITCLSPWRRTGASPSRLALCARAAPPACGLDRMSPARQGLAMLVRLGVTRFVAYHC